jgi:fatty-acyl-CoA synthase
MASFTDTPLRSLQDIERFEQALPFAQRLPARSVYEVFEASARQYPERNALTLVMTGEDDEQPRRLSYRDLLGQVRQAANLFHALGGPRPGVAYMLPNLVETHVTLWGAETAGFAVPINFLLQAEHVVDLVKASGAKLLVALGPHPQLDIWDKALAVQAQLPQLRLLRVTLPGAEAVAPDGSGSLDFQQALSRQRDDCLDFDAPGRDDDVAAYFHTGGTTGVPKLVAHTHRNQLVAAFGGSVLLHMAHIDVGFCGIPLFHVAGTIIQGLSCFMSGAEVVLLSPSGFRNPAMLKRYWHLVEKYRAVRIGGVPTILGALCEVPLDGADLSHVVHANCGAALTPRAVAERFEQHTGKPVHEVLGMTETAGVTCVDPVHGSRVLGSVGFRLPYTEVAVRRRNPDGSLGEVCAPDEIGVLTVKGPTVSPGYRDPEQNTGVFMAGMLNTGDLAYADADGRLYIAGRSKDLIIRSGHNIDPVMIEDAMVTHPAVALAAAVAQPDRYAGELPVCYVALRPGAQASEAELQAHAQQRIAERPAWPRSIVVLPALPVTGVGKVFKPQLRADAACRLVRQVLHDALGLSEQGAHIEAAEGGKRGMRVSISLAAGGAVTEEQVRQALAGYVFETAVSRD